MHKAKTWTLCGLPADQYLTTTSPLVLYILVTPVLGLTSCTAVRISCITRCVHFCEKKVYQSILSLSIAGSIYLGSKEPGHVNNVAA